MPIRLAGTCSTQVENKSACDVVKASGLHTGA